MKHLFLSFWGLLMLATCTAQTPTNVSNKPNNHSPVDSTYDMIWGDYEKYYWPGDTSTSLRIVSSFVTKHKYYTIPRRDKSGKYTNWDSTQNQIHLNDEVISRLDVGTNWDHVTNSRFLNFEIPGAEKIYDNHSRILVKGNEGNITKAMQEIAPQCNINLKSIGSVQYFQGTFFNGNFLVLYFQVYFYSNDQVDPRGLTSDSELYPSYSYNHIEIYNPSGKKIITMDFQKPQMMQIHDRTIFSISENGQFVLMQNGVYIGEGMVEHQNLILFDANNNKYYTIPDMDNYCNYCDGSAYSCRYLNGLFQVHYIDSKLYLIIDPVEKKAFVGVFSGATQESLEKMYGSLGPKPIWRTESLLKDKRFKQVSFE
jgi:hypothetical protein